MKNAHAMPALAELDPKAAPPDERFQLDQNQKRFLAYTSGR